VQGVLDAIPADWRVSKEALASYPAGSDIRPLASKCGILTERELEITDTSKDATDLLQELASASISAEETVIAFSKRAAVAHQAITCLAGFYYEDAKKRAVELDEILKRTGKPIGPLHGMC
jgi:amidase